MRSSVRGFVVLLLALSGWPVHGLRPTAMAQHAPSAEIRQQLQNDLQELRGELESLRQAEAAGSRDYRASVADVAVFEKAVTWLLKHDEFYQPGYVTQAQRVLERGRQRAAQLAAGMPEWPTRQGTSVRGYVSRMDGSVQPYALTLPAGVDPRDPRRWPLHVVLHGRANEMNEVNFIHRHEDRKSDAGATWIQLDVYGRGSNGYRWAGETDVFEALDDVKRRFRIDDRRITLHGFSMGGAGSWHLGLHYPDLWSSVGPGAGFVDFYKYQNHEERLPDWQHATLGIYDSVDYALNAANVPVCTYGGELDPQLLASTTMAEAAAASGVSIRVIVGPGMGHKFDPGSQRQFMAFHAEHAAAGRPVQQQRRQIRFTTRTLRYNQCDWLTIEEVDKVYQPSTVEAGPGENGSVAVSTTNIAALRISRDIADTVILDGDALPCRSAADGLLPDVWYRRSGDGWEVLDYDASRAFADNPDRKKRRGLQGPIDDAFMDAFVCVRGTGQALHPACDLWATSVLDRFAGEFDRWLRGEVRIVKDTELDAATIAGNHLVLFGDPGSNEVLRRILPELPIEWTATKLTVGSRSWDPATHGICLIFPNPLNPKRYVVINSGHTVHDADFTASNAWLFPRAGDIAVWQLPQAAAASDGASTDKAAADEAGEMVWAANFNASWMLD